MTDRWKLWWLFAGVGVAVSVALVAISFQVSGLWGPIWTGAGVAFAMASRAGDRWFVRIAKERGYD